MSCGTEECSSTQDLGETCPPRRSLIINSGSSVFCALDWFGCAAQIPGRIIMDQWPLTVLRRLCSNLGSRCRCATRHVICPNRPILEVESSALRARRTLCTLWCLHEMTYGGGTGLPSACMLLRIWGLATLSMNNLSLLPRAWPASCPHDPAHLRASERWRDSLDVGK